MEERLKFSGLNEDMQERALMMVGISKFGELGGVTRECLEIEADKYSWWLSGSVLTMVTDIVHSPEFIDHMYILTVSETDYKNLVDGFKMLGGVL